MHGVAVPPSSEHVMVVGLFATLNTTAPVVEVPVDGCELIVTTGLTAGDTIVQVNGVTWFRSVELET